MPLEIIKPAMPVFPIPTLMKQLAIRLSWQTTPAKSLVIPRSQGKVQTIRYVSFTLTP
jgi:hypothetical protein